MRCLNKKYCQRFRILINECLSILDSRIIRCNENRTIFYKHFLQPFHKKLILLFSQNFKNKSVKYIKRKFNNVCVKW